MAADSNDASAWIQGLPSPLCNVVLIEPLIPENTGNIARTCVGTDSHLHLVGPMGFEITESRVKRAGLDYWQHLRWTEYASTGEWQASVPVPDRVFYLETTARQSLFEAQFRAGDWLVFGKETSGLDKSLIEANDAHAFHIPMLGPVRSLNLSNSVAITVFELFRQVAGSPRVRRP
ncbi:MAG: tRNA (cytidine(34)-2'-O)-methyltransferase [Bdellovibrionaceae bacterium]|nr:tRNA (cytidine(34)-2'-O)-methyltransferase [Pseudobdellovibrionaceae bacterium]